jgi:hypothetical protein
LELCEERASSAFDSLSHLIENRVIACWHRDNLGFRPSGLLRLPIQPMRRRVQ